MAACDKPTVDKAILTSFDVNKNVGWVHGNCLAIKNNTLKAGTNITLVAISDQQNILEATITDPINSAEGCFALLEDRKAINQSNDQAFYLLNIPGNPNDLLAIGINIDKHKLTSESGKVQSDINGDGINESFTSCETSEGMNFYIWDGEPYKQLPIWTDYYYLGYDVTPTCPEG